MSDLGTESSEELTGPNRPDPVITTALRAKASNDSETSQSGKALVAGYQSHWSKLVAAGVPVVGLSDNPHPGSEIYTYVAENRENFRACDFPIEEGSGTPALRRSAEKTVGAEFVDLSPWLRIEDRCPPVIGKVLLYRQGSPLTAAYAETLSPVLNAEIPAAEQESREATSAD